jgi:signal transduction histidine kinase
MMSDLRACARFLFLITLAGCGLTGSASGERSPIDNPAGQVLLQNTERAAQGQAANNMNRFAMEKMQRYDYLLDSLYAGEVNDTLAAMESAYDKSAADRLTDIQRLNREIAETSSQKAELDIQYATLIRRALLSFAVWLVIVVVLLRYRNVRLKRSRANLKSTAEQRAALEAANSDAELLFKEAANQKIKLDRILASYARLRELLQTSNGNQTPVSLSGIYEKLEKQVDLVEKEIRLNDALLTQSVNEEGELVDSDINRLCGQYLDIASRGLQEDGEIVCQVTRDFEKNLPPVKFHQPAVGAMLLNVLINAFLAVREKSKQEIKGYEPKISVSTRILPRFLQIRVRDNGVGMSDAVLQQADKEYFTTRGQGMGAGLGLSYARTIVGEMHRGEIKIESEEGNSTDVYIKFFR